MVVVPVTVREFPPFRVTVYVTGQLEVDGFHATVALVAPTLVARTLVGTDGNVHVVVNDPVAALLVPPAVMATTVIEYAVPGVNVVYDTLVLLVVRSNPPLSLTLYVTGHPGSADTAVQETVAVVLATLLAVTPVGAEGAVHASVENEPVPGLLFPASFEATTRMVYAVPGVRPEKDTVVPLTVCVKPPFSVTVYSTAQSDVDAVQDTSAAVCVIRDASIFVGAPGNVQLVAKEPSPAALVPPSLLATTLMAYVVSGERFVYVTLVDVPVTVLSFPLFSVTV